MTKNEMARKVVQEMFSLKDLPDPRNIQVRNIAANRTKDEIQPLYDAAVRAEAKQTC